MSDPRFDRATGRFDILRVLQAAGMDPGPSGQGEIVGRCPFCEDRRHRLYVNARTKLWICFACDRRGNIIGLLTAPEIGNLTFEDAVRRVLRESYRGFDREPVSTDDGQAVVKLPREFQLLRLPPDRRSEPFWRYLTGRGLQPSLVEQYGLGYCRAGRHRWRVVVPVYLFGTLMTFVARWAADRVPERSRKVLTPQGSRSGEVLFNIERVWGRPDVVLTEGVFDALAMPDRALAVLGSTLSSAQMDLLEEAGAKTVTFCYDPDATGRRAVAGLADQLMPRFDVSVAHLPVGLDPAKAPPTVLHAALRGAVPWSFAEKLRLKKGGAL